MKNCLCVVLSLLGCGGNNNASTEVRDNHAHWQEATRIEYRYGDSSVAPDCHRSYTITITEATKEITIDSYGKGLLTRQYANNPSDFQAFVEELSKKGIKKHRKKKDEPCDGGTTETLRLYNKDVKFFDAYVYHCSGESGTLTMPAEASRLICNQIPEDIDSLINSTMRNPI